jgi:hypothetical protein
MTKVQFKKFEWDWKEGGPNWDEVNEFIKTIKTTPYFYKYDTNSDSYGVLVADTELMEVEVDLLVEED